MGRARGGYEATTAPWWSDVRRRVSGAAAAAGEQCGIGGRAASAWQARQASGGVGRWEREIENVLCGGSCERIGKTIQPISIAYIRWLTDEYKRARDGSPTLHIFDGGTTSPTNICGIYSSVTWCHRRIYGAGQNQTEWPIYSSVPDLNRRI
jgi:hypothetical protein